MGLSSDEARALAFIGALIALTLLGRWVDRPRPVGLEEAEVDVGALAARSAELLDGGGKAGGGTAGGGKAGGGTAGGGTAGTDGALSLNGATVSELEGLPGVGPALAGRIVARRDSVGPYRSVEELDSVKGIGPAMLARLKPLLRL